MGYKVINVSQVGLRASMQGVWDCAIDLMKRQEQAEKDFEKRLLGHPMGDYNKFARFPEFKELEAKYLPGEDVKKKYEASIGL